MPTYHEDPALFAALGTTPAAVRALAEQSRPAGPAPLYSLPRAAAHLGLCVRQLTRLRRRYGVPVVRRGHRKHLPYDIILNLGVLVQPGAAHV